jgi:hypothetical protein
VIDIVVAYDRSSTTVVEQHEFPDDLSSALSVRLSLEIAYRTRPEVEVVLLGAASIDDLKKSHARYFAPETISARLRTLVDEAVKKGA